MRTDIVPLIRVKLRQISARVTGVDGVDTPERIEQFSMLAAKVGAAMAGQFAIKPGSSMKASAPPYGRWSSCSCSPRSTGAKGSPLGWRQCALFLNASIQTSSHMLPHVFVHLDEWVDEHREDRAKLTDVDFLHAAIAESLRLHQSSPVRFCVANRDITLSTGREVKGGETLALYAPPANLETEIF